MKTKKALGGLFGLFGSFAAFFDGFVPVPVPLRFNLTNEIKSVNNNESNAKSRELDL